MNAAAWIGYLEHRSPEKLRHFRENAGKGGYTVFAEMIKAEQHRNLQGLPWCTTFVHAVIARPDILGRAHPGSRVLMRRMTRKGLWRGRDYTPERGDLIFCANDLVLVDHVAIVESADGTDVTSIDGNTNDPDGLFAPGQGGAVARVARRREDPMIAGYAAIGHLLHNGG